MGVDKQVLKDVRREVFRVNGEERLVMGEEIVFEVRQQIQQQLRPNASSGGPYDKADAPAAGGVAAGDTPIGTIGTIRDPIRDPTDMVEEAAPSVDVTELKILQLKTLLKYKAVPCAGATDKKALQELVSANATAAEINAVAAGTLGGQANSISKLTIAVPDGSAEEFDGDCDDVASAADDGIGGAAISEGLVQVVLQACSRTNAGGDSFFCLQELFASASSGGNGTKSPKGGGGKDSEDAKADQGASPFGQRLVVIPAAVEAPPIEILVKDREARPRALSEQQVAQQPDEGEGDGGARVGLRDVAVDGELQIQCVIRTTSLFDLYWREQLEQVCSPAEQDYYECAGDGTSGNTGGLSTPPTSPQSKVDSDADGGNSGDSGNDGASVGSDNVAVVGCEAVTTGAASESVEAEVVVEGGGSTSGSTTDQESTEHTAELAAEGRTEAGSTVGSSGEGSTEGSSGLSSGSWATLEVVVHHEITVTIVEAEAAASREASASSWGMLAGKDSTSVRRKVILADKLRRGVITQEEHDQMVASEDNFAEQEKVAAGTAGAAEGTDLPKSPQLKQEYGSGGSMFEQEYDVPATPRSTTLAVAEKLAAAEKALQQAMLEQDKDQKEDQCQSADGGARTTASTSTRRWLCVSVLKCEASGSAPVPAPEAPAPTAAQPLLGEAEEETFEL
jgi:hypothetical protein